MLIFIFVFCMLFELKVFYVHRQPAHLVHFLREKSLVCLFIHSSTAALRGI
jgi:hypothetical protein